MVKNLKYHSISLFSNIKQNQTCSSLTLGIMSSLHHIHIHTHMHTRALCSKFIQHASLLVLHRQNEEPRLNSISEMNLPNSLIGLGSPPIPKKITIESILKNTFLNRIR